MPVRIPGFVDAHCHAFQRALRGRDRGGDFWAWRDGMLALAESLTVEEIRREYVEVYRELRANGFTAVGEFHYLGLAEGRAAAAAAEEAGIAFVLVHACYLRGGLARFRQSSVAEYLRQVESLRGDGIRVAIAPHSVRACPDEGLRERARVAPRRGPAAARARGRAAPRDRGVPRRDRPPTDRAARPGRLPGIARDRGPRDPCRRPRARFARRPRRPNLRVPHDRGEPRRRLPARRPRVAPVDRNVHRQRLERADRSARGAA